MRKHVQSRPLVLLVRARLGRRWSQQELANQLGATSDTVSRWERGVTFPTPYFRQKLCDLLEKSEQELGLLTGAPASEELTIPTLSAPLEQCQQVAPEPLPVSLVLQAVPDPRPSFTLRARFHFPLLARRIGVGSIAALVILLVILRGDGELTPRQPLSLHMTTTPGVLTGNSSVALPGWARGQPTWSDPLTDVNPTNTQHGWTISSGLGPSCKFSQLYQYYQVHQVGLGYCYYGRKNWGDLLYEVDISIHAGTEGGLIWRLDTTRNAYYYFSITRSGEYEAWLVLHGSATSLASGFSSYIVRWTVNPVWNTLDVLAQGPQFCLFVNHHLITTITERSLSQGAIGLAVSSPQNQFSLAQYHSAKAWSPM